MLLQQNKQHVDLSQNLQHQQAFVQQNVYAPAYCPTLVQQGISEETLGKNAQITAELAAEVVRASGMIASLAAQQYEHDAMAAKAAAERAVLDAARELHEVKAQAAGVSAEAAKEFERQRVDWEKNARAEFDRLREVMRAEAESQLNSIQEQWRKGHKVASGCAEKGARAPARH